MEVYLYHNTRPFGDELMAAFGRFIVQWTRFEYELGAVFAAYLGGPVQRGMILFYSGIGYSSHKELSRA